MSFEWVDPRLKSLVGKSKDEARREYMEEARAARLKRPSSPTSELLGAHWTLLTVDIALLTPWHSKDDSSFHVLDNPLRRDRIYGVPFISGSTWKGLLRWAYRTQQDAWVSVPEPNQLQRWAQTELHLFGSPSLADEQTPGDEETVALRQGALAFRPTWFDKVDFEVINPHSRATRAGTNPIFYEVVPPGATGTVEILYAPAIGQAKLDMDQPEEALVLLLRSLEDLLTKYGFSAKRTSGWGLAEVRNAVLDSRRGTIRMKGKNALSEVARDVPRLLSGGVA